MKRILLLVVAFAMAISLNAQTIYELQGQVDDSPYADQEVTTTGIVTAVRSGGDPVEIYGFFIQDGVGEWNGIYVYSNVNQDVAVGDAVTVTGTCVEYYNMTEISPATDVVINSSDNALPDAAVITTAASSSTESYEGVLVKVEDAECTVAVTDDSHGIWSINDGSGEGFVDDWIFHLDPDATVGTHYHITGCIVYDFSQFKICPRDADDIEEVSAINEVSSLVSVYPNPVVNTLNISEEANVVILNITGQEIMNVVNTNSVNVSNLDAGVYFAQIQTQVGTSVEKFVKK